MNTQKEHEGKLENEVPLNSSSQYKKSNLERSFVIKTRCNHIPISLAHLIESTKNIKTFLMLLKTIYFQKLVKK